MSTYKQIVESMDGIGQRVRRLRREREMTQEEVGVAINSNQSVIQKIENGKSAMPRVLPELAAYFGVNPGWILFGPNYCDKHKGMK